jgi:hypothetical protein
MNKISVVRCGPATLMYAIEARVLRVGFMMHEHRARLVLPLPDRLELTSAPGESIRATRALGVLLLRCWKALLRFAGRAH